MPLPTAEPGLVIHYEFLWSHEAAAGQTEAEKRRPCAIIVATKIDAKNTSVIVAPITHKPPQKTATAVEIPPAVKRHLGLDAEQSWVIVNELNEFVWPGYYVHPIPNAPPGTYSYGLLPPMLFNQIRDRIRMLDAELKSPSPIVRN